MPNKKKRFIKTLKIVKNISVTNKFLFYKILKNNFQKLFSKPKFINLFPFIQ